MRQNTIYVQYNFRTEFDYSLTWTFTSRAFQIANLSLEFHSLACRNRSIIHWLYWQTFRPDDSAILSRTILVAIAFFIGTSIVLKTFANMVWWFISVEEKFLFSWKKIYVCNSKIDQKLMLVSFKWRNLSQTGKIGSVKNPKYFFFLLGLKYTLRTCFEYKNFSSNYCPELSKIKKEIFWKKKSNYFFL